MILMKLKSINRNIYKKNHKQVVNITVDIKLIHFIIIHHKDLKN